MTTDILLLIGALLTIATVGVFLSSVAKAPEGFEDDSGFHYRRNHSPVSRPPFVTKSLRLRAKKNAGLHLPAA